MSEPESLFDAREAAPSADADGLNAPVEWRGMPRFEPPREKRVTMVLSFDSEEDRERLVEQLGLVIAKRTSGTQSAWWPPREKEDLASLRFDFGET